jgi:hypothetical protein
LGAARSVGSFAEKPAAAILIGCVSLVTLLIRWSSPPMMSVRMMVNDDRGTAHR